MTYRCPHENIVLHIDIINFNDSTIQGFIENSQQDRNRRYKR